MQITDLNKIVSLFLVGSLALTIIILLWMDKLEAYYVSHHITGLESQIPGSLVVLVTTLLALGSAMFAGCIVDGLTECLFRSNMRRLIKKGFLRKIFWVGRQYEETELYRERLHSMLKSSDKYKPFHGDDSCETFAAALFFHTAKEGNVNWLVQHHAVHILTADYIFLILVFAVLLPIAHFLGALVGYSIKMLPVYWLCVLLLSLYPMCHLAIDRWLYTYEIAYRHGLLVLSDESQ